MEANKSKRKHIKKYLIVLKGQANIGKTTILKSLGEHLINKYEFKIWEIGACEKKANEYLKEQVNNCLLDNLKKDVFLDGDINSKKVIISTGGDYVRCIERFLEKFDEYEADIAITACRCEDKCDRKYLELLNKAQNNNVVFITISPNIIDENDTDNENLYKKLNKLKTNEVFNLIKGIL